MDPKKPLSPLENLNHSKNPIRANEWISGKELIARLGIRDFQIFDLMKQGLQAYNRIGKKIYEKQTPISQYHYEIRKAEWTTGEYPGPSSEMDTTPENDREYISYTLPNNESQAAKALSKAMSYHFKEEDVLDLERELGLAPQDQQVLSASPALSSSQEDKGNVVDIRESTGSLPKDQVKGDNYFIREGNIWRIGFGEEKGSFHDYAYIRCIVLLLNKPGKAISCTELYRLMDRNTVGKEIMTEKRAMAEGLSVPTRTKDSDVINDPDAIKEYKKRLQTLVNERDKIESDLNSRNPETELELLQIYEEIQFLEKELLKHKRFNTFEASTKKVQSNIRKHLKTAYATIKKAPMKRLSKHLTEKIKPAGGYDYRYTDTDTHWEISW